MNSTPFIILFCLLASTGHSQKKSISQMKMEIEKAANPPRYVKDSLKKKFRMDTIVIRSTTRFERLADSIAYHGKIRKVYGPFENGKILVQVLAKLPGTFNHIGQIFLDTSVFMKRFADSLADDIIKRINEGKASFGEMAETYSMGGEGPMKGDLGWVAMGAMLPQIEKELGKRKKGEIFKLWTRNGVHIIRKLDNGRKDTGYALMMVIFI